MAKYYIGDIGTIIKVTTGADFTVLTDASVDLIVKKPGDSTGTTWDATIATSSTEKAAGIVRHVVDGTTDVDSTGTYTLQALVYENPGSSENQWYGQTTTFTVSNLWT